MTLARIPSKIRNRGAVSKNARKISGRKTTSAAPTMAPLHVAYAAENNRVRTHDRCKQDEIDGMI